MQSQLSSERRTTNRNWNCTTLFGTRPDQLKNNVRLVSLFYKSFQCKLTTNLASCVLDTNVVQQGCTSAAGNETFGRQHNLEHFRLAQYLNHSLLIFSNTLSCIIPNHIRWFGNEHLLVIRINCLIIWLGQSYCLRRILCFNINVNLRDRSDCSYSNKNKMVFHT